MPVCSFFLQGRCRYGEKCWNEHPRGGSRGGGGGGGYNNNNYGGRSPGQQQSRSGGFGNRVWVNPSQQKGSYIQPSSFSQGSDDWGHGGGGGGGGGGGRRDNVKSSEFSFSTQNRFSSLDTPSNFDRGAGEEDDDKKLEIIQMDMDVWEKSGQWGFSCYCSFRTPISGFNDLSPEELRLEYYSTRASGDLQSYVSGCFCCLHSLFSLQLAELNGTAPQASSGGFGSTSATGFGSSTSSFGSKGFGAPAPVQASGFSFSASNSGFGSASTQSSSTGFGSILAAATQHPSGFGSASSSAPSASTFSFASTDKPAAASGFGSASGFSLPSTASTGGGFGSGFGVVAPAATGSSSTFVQKTAGFEATQPTSGTGTAGGASDSLFSPQSKLTEEELNQFKAKRFTLGQIPLKPPPADLLAV
uniref:Nucleoporin NUP42 n=1 Tax=Amphilophus citrinellus TaxID=61819 RepID=A0A3Q0QZ13_AMPCI